jgi:hypothetical protein
VSDFLVVYLDSIDERLLEHLDEDDKVHGPLALPRKGSRGSCTIYQYRRGSVGP